MFDELKKHHIGIIVSDEQRKKIEKCLKRKFNMDKTQGTRVLFEKDPYLGFYKEYIVKEGRVKDIPLGFAHICYDVKNQSELNKIENFCKFSNNQNIAKISIFQKFYFHEKVLRST